MALDLPEPTPEILNSRQDNHDVPDAEKHPADTFDPAAFVEALTAQEAAE